ncbi:MAG: DUF433 domain-containing protein [Bacteroidales bacterium]|nr:DUF433 domain-containing protein [Bacteroidales bacterium]
MENIKDYISIDPDIRFGKPCIKGTRIAVHDILQWLSSGMSYLDILNDYPTLNEDSIKAVLFFAANRENVTRIIAA